MGYNKKISVGLMLLAIVSIVSVSCRTTEANYRAAYEAAVAGRQQADDTGIDNTVYDKIRRQAVNNTIITQTGDTIPAKRERVKLYNAASGQKLLEAYVVVAQFKQIFNAKSMTERLVAAGYEGSVVLETSEPLYYVTIGGGDVLLATELYNKYKSTPVVECKQPYPLILQPVR